MPRILENKYYVDEIYDAAIINPIKVGSREGLWKIFDIGVIDGFLHGLGQVVTEGGKFIVICRADLCAATQRSFCLGALARDRHLCLSRNDGVKAVVSCSNTY